MKVLRGGENQFTALLTEDETVKFDCYSARDGKTIEEFIVWLLDAGIKIYELTLEIKR